MAAASRPAPCRVPRGRNIQAMTTLRIKRLWELLDRPDSAALHGLISGALWFVLGAVLGNVMSHELTLPDLFQGIPEFVFSRLRPVHVNMMLFGFLTLSFYGAWYYMMPRLCRTDLRTNRTANLVVFFWNLGIVGGSIALMLGQTQGREYAEYPWYIDWPIEALFVVNAAIIVRTIAARAEPKLYVSIWYIAGSVVWIAMLYAIGSVIWHPQTQTLADGQIQRSGALVGLDDAIWNWFYGHNVFGLFITTGGIAIVYYLVPKLSRRPVYSHTLSLIGFWAIAVMYSPTGQHHLLQAPIPTWSKIYSIIGSVALIIPVFSQSTNVFMTMRGVWGKMIEDIPLRFVLTGAYFYLAVSIQGSIQSLMTVNRFVHFTQWVVAHSHLALLGGFGFIASGALLYMVPQITRKPLWSRNLADAQYWLMLLGLTGFFWAITASGLAQANAWINMGQQVVKSFQVLKPYFYLRSVFGAMILAGAVLQLVNVYMTLRVPAEDAAARWRKRIADIEEIGPPAAATAMTTAEGA
jgi:cytochrome c oxidase cbb3-type subunit 1